MKTLDTARIESPVGPLLLFADGDALVSLEFFTARSREASVRARLRGGLGAFETREAHDPAGAVTRLKRYFAGELGAFDEQPVQLHGTEFQLRVWNALRGIPAGETRGYGQLAAELGVPHSSRAVGAANGSNPIALFVPCHRVIAADGTLHGYGGGLDRKRWLLEHEGAKFRGGSRDEQLTLV